MEEEIDDKGGFVPNNSKVPDQSGELLILEKGKMARIYGSVKKTYFNIGSRVYPMMTRPRGLLLSSTTQTLHQNPGLLHGMDQKLMLEILIICSNILDSEYL